ncbi:hypothetical protein [Teredinibacter turnerae]|uniref:hypothetical protein n=1 Tax=Teredinibacter turnerae TaxID=2426 RepID=UPI0005F7F467
MRVLIFLLMLLQGCTSNMYLGRHENVKGVSKYSPQVVRVANPEHPNYTILKQSGLFEIVNDDSVPTVLTLQDSEITFRCGNGLIAPIFTLGILPGYLNASENFSFTLERSGQVNTVEYFLDVYERYSIWEWFIKPFKSSDEKIKGKALFVASKASQYGITTLSETGTE